MSSITFPALALASHQNPVTFQRLQSHNHIIVFINSRFRINQYKLREHVGITRRRRIVVVATNSGPDYFPVFRLDFIPKFGYFPVSGKRQLHGTSLEIEVCNHAAYP
jgi:hypothetical protein